MATTFIFYLMFRAVPGEARERPLATAGEDRDTIISRVARDNREREDDQDDQDDRDDPAVFVKFLT